MKKWLIVLVLYVGIDLVYCQTDTSAKYTLKQCVEISLQNNILLKQNNLNISSSQVQLQQSKEAILPNLNGSANVALNFGRSIDPVSNTFINRQQLTNNFSLSSNMMVFNGFRIMNVIKQNELNLNANKYDYQEFKNTIILNVVTAYTQVIFNIEILKVAQNQLKLIELQVQRSQKLVQSGILPESNLFDLKSQKSNIELNALNAENQLVIAKLNLSQLMNIPFDSENPALFEIEIPEIKIDTIDNTKNPQELYIQAAENQPIIKRDQIRLRSSELGIKIATANIFPRITLNGNIFTLYSDQNKKFLGIQNLQPIFGDYPWQSQIGDNVAQSVSLTLIVPVYNNYIARGGVQNAIIAKKNAEFIFDNNKLQLRKKIELAYVDAKLASKKFEAIKMQILANQEAFRATEKRFDAGIINAVDYNISSNILFRSTSEILQAKYDLFLKTKILDFYKVGELTY